MHYRGRHDRRARHGVPTPWKDAAAWWVAISVLVAVTAPLVWVLVRTLQIAGLI